MGTALKRVHCKSDINATRVTVSSPITPALVEMGRLRMVIRGDGPLVRTLHAHADGRKGKERIANLDKIKRVHDATETETAHTNNSHFYCG